MEPSLWIIEPLKGESENRQASKQILEHKVSESISLLSGLMII